MCWVDTGLTLAASGEIPETCRVLARENPFVDKEIVHNIFLLRSGVTPAEPGVFSHK
jgi:hypothetical protein